jgi:hypothetical protein
LAACKSPKIREIRGFLRRLGEIEERGRAVIGLTKEASLADGGLSCPLFPRSEAELGYSDLGGGFLLRESSDSSRPEDDGGVD